MSRFKGFVRVASSYDVTDVRMAVAALEGADILAITPGAQLTSVMPHTSLAFGPIEVLVPEPDAEEAKALLYAIETGTIIPHDQRDLLEGGESPEPIQTDATIGDKIRNILGFLVGGVSAPLRGLSVEKSAPNKRD